MSREVDDMEDLKCISFDSDKLDRHINDNFNEYGSSLESGYLVDIKVNGKDFNIFVGDIEETKESKKYAGLYDCHFGTVTVIKALKTLTKYLEMSIDIEFSKNLIE